MTWRGKNFFRSHEGVVSFEKGGTVGEATGRYSTVVTGTMELEKL
jgi:hypothetical protein